MNRRKETIQAPEHHAKLEKEKTRKNNQANGKMQMRAEAGPAD